MADGIEMVQEVPQKLTVQQVLNDCISKLNELEYKGEEVVKFGFLIQTVIVPNIRSCVEAMDESERKAREEAAKANPIDEETIAEVKRYEEAEQDGRTEV